jgi:CRISPR-associated protein Csb2
VLDRAPSRRLDEEQAIYDTITRAGFPEPIQVQSELAPIRPGDPRFGMRHTLRRPGDRRRPFRYLRIRFPKPVQGPVLIGAMRHFGLGLCRRETPGEDGGRRG